MTRTHVVYDVGTQTEVAVPADRLLDHLLSHHDAPDAAHVLVAELDAGRDTSGALMNAERALGIVIDPEPDVDPDDDSIPGPRPTPGPR